MNRLILALILFWIACVPPTLARNTPQPTGLGWRQAGTASSSAPFIVTDLTDGLDQERALVSGNGFFVFTDGGPNGNLTLNVGTDLAVTDGGTGSSTAAGALINLIGTPTKGKIIAGNGSNWVLLDAAAGDDYLLTSDATQATGMKWATAGATGPSNVQYLVLALDAGLSNERRLVGTANKITLTDGGANGDLTLNIGTDVVTLTGTQSLSNKTLTNPIVNDTIIFEKGSNDLTITASAPAAARAYNMTDVGADAFFIMSQGAQTKAGVLTLSSAPVLSTGTITVGANTITFPAATDTLVNLASAQSLTNKTAVSLIAETSIVLKQTTANYTLTWVNPAAARQVRIQDVGANSDAMLKDQGDSYTAGGVPYGDGSLMQISSGGSEGDVFTMGASNIPSWQAPNNSSFGGNGGDGPLSVSSGGFNVDPYRTGQYTDINITDTVDGLFVTEYTAVLNATGNITIDGNVTVNRDTETGGTSLLVGGGDHIGIDGGGIGGGKGAYENLRSGGGGAASAVAWGGFGGTNATDHITPKTLPHFQLFARSGGGGCGSGDSGGSQPGQAGGGLPSLIFCAVGYIHIDDDALIVAHGGNATFQAGSPERCGGSAGGASPTIGFFSQDEITVNVSAQVETTGGDASNAGSSGNNGGAGGGGGGLQVYYAPTVTVSATTVHDGGAATNGVGSGGNGQPGQDGYALIVEGTPSTLIMSWLKESDNVREMIAQGMDHRDICRAVSGGNMVAYIQLLGESQAETCFVTDVVELGNAA